MGALCCLWPPWTAWSAAVPGTWWEAGAVSVNAPRPFPGAATHPHRGQGGDGGFLLPPWATLHRQGHNSVPSTACAPLLCSLTDPKATVESHRTMESLGLEKIPKIIKPNL